MSQIVIGVVVVDLVVLALTLLGELFHAPHLPLIGWLHAYAPLLIFVAAVLPAAVASLNGVRFQSECRRLSDRSGVMARLLKGNAESAREPAAEIDRSIKGPAADVAAWCADVLRFAEFCERELAEEATEWSVLYAKEVHET